MSKFNKPAAKPSARGPMSATAVYDEAREFAPALNHGGAPVFALDQKSELFTLATTNLVGEDTFYESAGKRDERFNILVRGIALLDVEWLTDFLRWLRNDGNMRSAAITGAAEAVKARLDAGVNGGNRALVDAVLQRADEPGEFVAYWATITSGATRVREGGGVRLPSAVKRGLADAVGRLYNEYALLKWDSDKAAVRFGDVVDLVHPKPHGPASAAGYEAAIAMRHGRVPNDLTLLPMLDARRELMAVPVAGRRAILADPERLKRAGMTWESLAGWLQGPMDADAWEAVIPSMGYMALIRNLRNFDEAGIGTMSRQWVQARIADEQAVAKSRQLPFRFLSAYMATENDHYRASLSLALDFACANIPTLGGRTLILVDTSASMCGSVSEKSKVSHAQVAALFAHALAAAGDWVDLISFATGSEVIAIKPGASVLRSTEDFVRNATGRVGHGTNMADAVRRHFQAGQHTRVVVISDMQMFSGYRGAGIESYLPSNVPTYAFDTTGYGTTVVDAGSKNRHQLGGLTDHTFKMIPMLERGQNAGWPWEAGEKVDKG